MQGINNYTYNPNFRYGGYKKSMQNSRKADGIELLINKSMEALKAAAEYQVPENSRFRRVYAAFDMPENPYEALISLSCDELQPKDMRRISAAVHKPKSSKYYIQYIFKGTKNDILQYLSDEKSQTEIKNALKELSEKLGREEKDEQYNL